MILGGELSPYKVGRERGRKAKRRAGMEDLDMVLGAWF